MNPNFREPICRSEMVLTARGAEKLRRKLQRLPWRRHVWLTVAAAGRMPSVSLAFGGGARCGGGNCAVKQMKTWSCLSVPFGSLVIFSTFFALGMFSRAAAATRAIASRHPLFLQPVVNFAPPSLRAATFPLDMDGKSMCVRHNPYALASDT